MGTAHVKGLAFQSVMRQIAKIHGRAAADASLAAMPRALHDALAAGLVLAHVWYPIADYRAMWAGIVAAIGGSSEEIRRVGREALLDDIATFYRPLVRMLSPATVTSLGARYFNRFYDTGSMRVLGADSNRIAARFEGCAGFDHTMWLEVAGSVEAFVELSGVRDVNVAFTNGGRDGDDFAELVARWR